MLQLLSYRGCGPAREVEFSHMMGPTTSDIKPHQHFQHRFSRPKQQDQLTSRKQSSLGWRTCHLHLLHFLQQLRRLCFLFQSQVNITPRGPLPWRDEERMAVNFLVTQNPQQALSRILCFCKVDTRALHMIEDLPRQYLGAHVPRTDDVNARLIVMCHTTHGMHDPTVSEFGTAIFGTAWHIEEAGAGTNEYEAGI